MSINYRTVLAVAIAALGGASQAKAADGASITLYRSDSPTLYASGGESNANEGYAVVRERRTVSLQSGVHDVCWAICRTSSMPKRWRWAFPVARRRLFRSGCCLVKVPTRR